MSLRASTATSTFSVSDTGQGIRPDFLPHVFERFRQGGCRPRRGYHGGLGLGLSIVKNLVEMHGGTVDARERGRRPGSVFTVRLPLALAGARPEPSASTGQVLAGRAFDDLLRGSRCSSSTTSRMRADW